MIYDDGMMMGRLGIFVNVRTNIFVMMSDRTHNCNVFRSNLNAIR